MNKVLVLPDLKYYQMKATQKIKLKLDSLAENDISVSTRRSKANDIDIIKQEIIDEYDSLYLEHHNEYMEQVNVQNLAKEGANKLKVLSDQEIILEIIINSYITSMKSITAKVKEILQIKSLSRIVNVVQFNVRVPHDPEHVIANPFENNLLPGIYRNLLIKYQKCTYVSFVGLLIQAINWSITDDIAIKNPLQAVSDVTIFGRVVMCGHL